MSLDFLSHSHPDAGSRVTVAEGIEWLTMPLPFALDHVNIWVLQSDDDVVVIDTGIDNQTIRDLWQHQLTDFPGGNAGANSHPGAAESCQRRLLITHYHPDHAGLSGWLAQQLGASEVYFHAQEYVLAERTRAATDATVREESAKWYRSHGLADSIIEAMGARGNSYRRIVAELPARFTALQHGDMVRVGRQEWQVIVAGGHAPAMLCLYNAASQVLIAADHILPRITPNVSLSWYSTTQDPLSQFLEAFERFSELPPDTLVLPSHGLPFRGLHTRIEQLLQHHHERLEEVCTLCKTPKTAAELLPFMFRPDLDAHQMMFAMGEALAHLRYLEVRERLLPETDGAVIRYRAC